MRIRRWKDKRKSKGREQCKIIGMVGAMEGVGVTHTLLALSTYLSGYQGKRVAYVEFREISHVHFLRKAAGIESEDSSFTLRGVDYYPEADEMVWLQLQQISYDYILIDYGVYCTDQMEQYARCHVNILIGSLCEWKRNAYEQILQTVNYSSSPWICFASLSSEYDRKKIKQEYGVYVWGVPCIVDPFILEKHVTSFWNQFSL
ncbi:hypothetical protein [Anaerosporobacter faecicola]|uniref:hypothetical protein n=1 Tax=Anaerosporobacter faecicola TaxID=2718714 RepID=UPI001438CAD6|nr:hypothetical protein [Anaerosporobacter faecicola]